MMWQKFFGVCLGILLIVTGCQNASDSISSTTSGAKATTITGTQIADDSAGSAILSTTYPTGTTVIVAVGDSITAGKGASIGYPARLANKLAAAGKNVVVINRGISGEQSPETDDRFLSSIAGTKIVLLMIGINDIINPTMCSDEYCQTLYHIEHMLDLALYSNITPVVSTITPIRDGSYFETRNASVNAINAGIAASATTRQIVMVDNNSAIITNGGDSLYSDANVHFNDSGYDVIAQQWCDAIIANNLITSSAQ
jgi:lysophospholipase L1-like esterase